MGFAEPTGLEHVTPVKIKDTSATERAGFRKCRRQWFLTVVHRLDPQEGSPYLVLGNLTHRALQVYYESLKAGLSHNQATDEALDAYQDAWDEEKANLKQQLGIAWPMAEPLWKETAELGMEMTQNYLEAEALNPIGDEIVAVEFRVNVAIRSPKGRRIGWLSVQADLVVMRHGELTVVDHKTRGRAVSGPFLDIDDQLSAEVFSWWKHGGDFPERAILNVLYRKAPHPPRQIKGTKAEPIKLSKDKSQGTTYELYRREIERLGLDKANYVDILTYLHNLDEMGENTFFERAETFRTPQQMAAFERDLYHEFRDMRDVAAHPEKAYPNPTQINCSGCPVRTICFTIQDGGDASAIIKAGYVVADPRR